MFTSFVHSFFDDLHESPLPCVSHLTPLFEGARRAVTALFNLLNRRFQRLFCLAQQHVLRWTRPKSRSLFVGTLNDLARTRATLIVENALLLCGYLRILAVITKRGLTKAGVSKAAVANLVSC